jgi:hypothetical protein
VTTEKKDNLAGGTGNPEEGGTHFLFGDLILLGIKA